MHATADDESPSHDGDATDNAHRDLANALAQASSVVTVGDGDATAALPGSGGETPAPGAASADAPTDTDAANDRAPPTLRSDSADGLPSASTPSKRERSPSVTTDGPSPPSSVLDRTHSHHLRPRKEEQ